MFLSNRTPCSSWSMGRSEEASELPFSMRLPDGKFRKRGGIGDSILLCGRGSTSSGAQGRHDASRVKIR